MKMKMNTEQKAKAYDEAIERAKNCLKDGAITYTAKSYIEEIFPELAESEHEKVRKELIEFVTSRLAGFPQCDKYLTWLEKKGEQSKSSPIWKYKKDSRPLLLDSLILNKYGCVAKSPSGAIVSNVWVLDYDALAKLPKEEFEKQDDNSIHERYDRIKDSEWFKKTHEGMSVSDDENIEGDNNVEPNE